MKETNIHPEDQIQMPGFRQIIRAAFRLLFQLLDLSFNALVKGKYIILTGIVLGLIAGFFYANSRSQVYRATMIVKYNTLSPQTYAGIIGQLNQLTGGKGDLATALKIPNTEAWNIISLEAQTVYNTPVFDTAAQSRAYFRINVVTQKPMAEGYPLQEALLTYLNNRPYVIQSKEAERKIYTEKLEFLNKELAKTEDPKAGFNQLLAFAKPLNTNTVNPAGFYVQYLISEKEFAQRILLYDAKAISLIDGFKEFIDPPSLPLARPLILLAAAGAFLGFIIAFLVETRKKLV